MIFAIALGLIAMSTVMLLLSVIPMALDRMELAINMAIAATIPVCLSLVLLIGAVVYQKITPA